jgi:hypothetical protein
MQTSNELSSRAGVAIANKYLSIALAVAAFATLGAAPALAKHHHHRVVHSTATLYNQSTDSFGDMRSNPDRNAALTECNLAAQKFSDSAWETAKSAAYATCMTNHGQMP